jgi:drug/metabolite transporter (DMT)-like permease
VNPYVLTIFANFSFALGSQFFTHYTRKFSSTWMNTFKAMVAAICFLLTILVTGGFSVASVPNFLWFFVSGFIALGFGDIFLLMAFGKIGPGRTMVLFGFHPVVVGVISFFLFGQSVDTTKLWGIAFFIGCLLTFSYESFKLHGKWEISGLFYAFLGMFLDAVGVIITRYAFDFNTDVGQFEGNFYRCVGALCCYFLVRKFRPFSFRQNLKKLNRKSLFYVTLGAFFGTYLSLACYLQAIKTANLASVTAISITSVIFSASIECIWERKLPTKYLWISLIWFAIGMKLLLFS